MSDRLKIIIGDERTLIGVRHFVSVISNTVKLLTAIDCDISKDRTPALRWRVRGLSMSSPLVIEIEGEVQQGRGEIRPVSSMMSGLKRMASDKTRPSHFTDEAMSAVRRLAIEHISHSIVLESNGRSVSPSACIIDGVDAIVGRVDAYRAETSLDGRLDAIYLHGENPQFLIWDPITDRSTRCYFSEQDVEDVVGLLTNRVRVFGTARFNKRDEATSIEVDEFFRLPERGESPTLADLHAAGIDITGGEDAADYVRRLRDGE